MLLWLVSYPEYADLFINLYTCYSSRLSRTSTNSRNLSLSFGYFLPFIYFLLTHIIIAIMNYKFSENVTALRTISLQKSDDFHSLTHRAEPFLRSCRLCSHSRTSQCFMKPERSLPRSQEPSTSPNPEPERSNPYHPIQKSDHSSLFISSDSVKGAAMLNVVQYYQYPKVNAN
jgi:hypothetical protein